MALFSIKLSENSKTVKSHYLAPFSYVLAAIAFSNSYIYQKSYQVSTLAFFCFISGVAACFIPVIKKKVSSHYFTANLVVVIFFACIIMISLYSGGLSSNAIWWLASIPIVATFLLNAFFGIVWLIAILVSFSSLIYLSTHDLLPLNVMLNASSEGRIIVSFTMNALLISILCVLADLIRERAFDDKEELQLKAFQLNQVASLGKMASGVSHEINNPLTVIKGSQLRIARMLEENGEVDKEMLLHYLDKINKNVQRIQRVTGLMKSMSEQGLDRSIFDINLNLLLKSVIKMLSREMTRSSVQVETQFPDKILFFRGIYAEIFQAFFNIVENAIQELDEIEGRRLISIKLEQTEEGIVVLIEDNGRGISTQAREHVFDPFFTTKFEGVGKGLGLTFAFNAFMSCGGRLELLDDQQKTVFKVTLPNLGRE